ncbi:MAG TPA: hypothetical protein VGP63_26565 [Planctomycetaceae bacterium]|nr:hypothetical protein [Planctomycetaceae bacterium]
MKSDDRTANGAAVPIDDRSDDWRNRASVDGNDPLFVVRPNVDFDGFRFGDPRPWPESELREAGSQGQ